MTDDKIPCKQCNTKGIIEKTIIYGLNCKKKDFIVCPVCNGNGYLYNIGEIETKEIKK